uniref:Uncharacterized protein n=1 Tax=Arundo donax TaxID=35708 RepID=A0A0A9FRT1_ARUDO
MLSRMFHDTVVLSALPHHYICACDMTCKLVCTNFLYIQFSFNLAGQVIRTAHSVMYSVYLWNNSLCAIVKSPNPVFTIVSNTSGPHVSVRHQ